jgi:putative methyltransferase (TIGR04325 family)
MLLTLDEELKDLLFGYVLALAARDRPKVRVLDYGGGLGNYYWLARALVPGTEFDYHCRELSKVAEAGRQLTPAVTWHTDDACLAQPHDLVMFSGSLQCLEEWRDVLCRAAWSARGYLFLSDVPTVRDSPVTSRRSTLKVRRTCKTCSTARKSSITSNGQGCDWFESSRWARILQ